MVSTAGDTSGETACMTTRSDSRPTGSTPIRQPRSGPLGAAYDPVTATTPSSPAVPTQATTVSPVCHVSARWTVATPVRDG